MNTIVSSLLWVDGSEFTCGASALEGVSDFAPLAETTFPKNPGQGIFWADDQRGVVRQPNRLQPRSPVALFHFLGAKALCQQAQPTSPNIAPHPGGLARIVSGEVHPSDVVVW